MDVCRCVWLRIWFTWFVTHNSRQLADSNGLATAATCLQNVYTLEHIEYCQIRYNDFEYMDVTTSCIDLSISVCPALWTQSQSRKLQKLKTSSLKHIFSYITQCTGSWALCTFCIPPPVPLKMDWVFEDRTIKIGGVRVRVSTSRAFPSTAHLLVLSVLFETHRQLLRIVISFIYRAKSMDKVLQSAMNKSLIKLIKRKCAKLEGLSQINFMAPTWLYTFLTPFM